MRKNEGGIKIERSYPEPYEWERILFSSNNSAFQVDTLLDCGIRNFEEIGEALILFPKKSPDEYSFTLESEWGGGDFSLHAYADKLGHTTLEVTIQSRAVGQCRISFTTTPSEIHRLGELLLGFSKPKYRGLKWSLEGDNDALMEWDHTESPSKYKEKKNGWTFGPNPDWWNPG